MCSALRNREKPAKLWSSLNLFSFPVSNVSVSLVMQKRLIPLLTNECGDLAIRRHSANGPRAKCTGWSPRYDC